MIARAAELNPTCFRPEGKLPSIQVAREFVEQVPLIISIHISPIFFTGY